MLLMTGAKADFDWYAAWSKQDLQAHFAFMHAFNKELKDSGVYVAAEGLGFPDHRNWRKSLSVHGFGSFFSTKEIAPIAGHRFPVKTTRPRRPAAACEVGVTSIFPCPL
jgi:hypothetical protein